jgi:hypothetical protein
MSSNYESKRITLSYPALERLREVYGLPLDVPSNTIAGYVERLIFEALSPTKTQQIKDTENQSSFWANT